MSPSWALHQSDVITTFCCRRLMAQDNSAVDWIAYLLRPHYDIRQFELKRGWAGREASLTKPFAVVQIARHNMTYTHGSQGKLCLSISVIKKSFCCWMAEWQQIVWNWIATICNSAALHTSCVNLKSSRQDWNKMIREQDCQHTGEG